MASRAFQLRWGIISTGKIAISFVKDLVLDPTTRGTTDVIHKVTAVGSRDVSKAQEFINSYVSGDKAVKAYGNYEGVYADKDVDAVYIGTPHTLHYYNARDAILAGKHILCEKPVTSNAAELRSLLALAKERKVFFMEAMWTKFQPLSIEFQRIVREENLGDPMMVHADLSSDFHIETLPLSHRMMDPRLGGGALLDLGPYPLVWAILSLYEHPSNKNSRPTSITGSMLKTGITGVDACTSFTLTFTKTLQAQANLSCSMTLPSPNPGVTIRYRNGNILIHPPIYCPHTFTVQYFDKPGGTVAREEKKSFTYVGTGWNFEADEVARCVRDGNLESDKWTHEKSLMAMDIFDEVRRQGGYVFPEGVEAVV